MQEEKLLEDDSITIIKQQLGVISNLRKAQGILQNAMWIILIYDNTTKHLEKSVGI